MIIATALLLLGILPNSLKSQQLLGKWIIPTTKYQANFTTHELTFTDDGVEINSTLMPPTYDPVEFSAGGYNENYQLNFYVLGEDAYNITANSGTNYQDWIPSTYGELHPEYQIIPKPGSQNQYYSFYTGIDLPSKATEIFFYYNEITYGTNTLSFLGNNIIHSSIRADGGYVAFAISDDNYLYASIPSSNASSPYNLAALRKWEITSTGINFIESIVDQTTSGLDEQDFDAYNLEVKKEIDNDVVIAWIHGKNDYANGFDVSELVVVTDGIGAKYPLGLGRLAGIEFSLYEDNIIYVSSNSGLYKVNYTNGTVIYPAIVQNNFSKTFVQTAPDGHIYAASDDGKTLGRIYQYSEGSYNQGDFLATAIDFPSDHKISSVCELVNNQEYYILPENHRIHNIMTYDVETTPTCPGHYDGTATITVEGGYPSYSLVLKRDGNVIAGPINNNGEPYTFTNLGAGSYVCVVTDSYNNVMNIPFIIHDIDYDENYFLTYSSTEPILMENINNRTYKLGFELVNNTKMTISNSTFMFGPDAKILIEPGSELIVNGSTLTNHEECYDPWLGIQVEGNSEMSQYQYPDGTVRQGKLVVENNSYIKNAWTGITNYKKGVAGTNGGIVLLSNSTFENNMRTIDFREYTNFNPVGSDIRLPYRCEFINLDFEVNNSYLFTEYVTEFIKFDNVEGINIRGCRFHNNHTAGQNRGIGINSINAGYHIVDYVHLGQTYISEFYNLYKGLNVLAGVGTNTIIVDSVDFINNSIGVYISGVNYTTIIDSKFEIGYNYVDMGSCGYSMGYGIDNQDSYGFVFEENNFKKYTGAQTGFYTGIRVYECPSNIDIIYKNYFEGLSYGNYAYGTNRYLVTDKYGVKYECNENIGNVIDFIVTHETDPSLAMIHTNHGAFQDHPSGNTFSTIFDPEINWHFRNEGEQNINWYYCSDQSYCPYQTPTHYMDNCDNNEVCFTPLTVSPSLYDCPSHYNKIDDIKLDPTKSQQLETDYAINNTDYQSVHELFESLKDGGNTTSELLDIQTATPDEMWALRTQLLGHSPHLSEEVLKEVADRTDVFPESTIFDIMAANPEELKQTDILEYLENKEEPLPDYMISLLGQISNGTTYKTALLNDMDLYHTNRIKAAQDIIRGIIIDSIVDYTDYRNWLDNIGILSSDKQIIGTYLSEGDTSSAKAMLNILPGIYNLTGNELDAFNDYCYLINLDISLRNNGLTYYDLDSAEIDNLQWLADSSSLDAKWIARNILSTYHNDNYCNCLYISDSATQKSDKINNAWHGINKGLALECSPNPARSWTQFSYILPVSNTKAEIIITDITGKPIDKLVVTGNKGKKLWDTRNIPDGIYICTLKTDGGSATRKIIINK